MTDRHALGNPAPEVVGHHRHRPRRFRALAPRDGVPYEIERIVCSKCAAVIAERMVRRADT